jgi:hypothetical protein
MPMACTHLNPARGVRVMMPSKVIVIYTIHGAKRMKCNRCGKETNVHIMSMFNTEEICMDCKALEKLRPDYKNAVETDEQAIRRGNVNFPGIGFRKNDA